MNRLILFLIFAFLFILMLYLIFFDHTLSVRKAKKLTDDERLPFISFTKRKWNKKYFSILGFEFKYLLLESDYRTMETENGKEKSKVAVFRKTFENMYQRDLFVKYFCTNVLKKIGNPLDDNYSKTENIADFSNFFSYTILDGEYEVSISKRFFESAELLIYIENNVRIRSEEFLRNRNEVINRNSEKILNEMTEIVNEKYKELGLIKE